MTVLIVAACIVYYVIGLFITRAFVRKSVDEYVTGGDVAFFMLTNLVWPIAVPISMLVYWDDQIELKIPFVSALVRWFNYE